MQRNTFLSLILLASTTAAADLPKGEVLMDRFVELTGGVAAYKDLKSQSIKSEIEFVGGKPETSWFSKATGLVVKTEFTLVSAMGELPISILVSDYRKVGAFLLPHRSIQSMGPQKMDNKIIELLINPEIEEAKLEPPADIKALIAKEQKTN
ncbi:MAG: hypothetical protein NTW74_16460 [Acidobacteria bacterium]|nr:hypothetical protein [Acidobacteriota bacterium]